MEHEGLDVGVMVVQHLVDQEVDHVTVPTAEPGHELRTGRRRLQRESREVDPSRPALGALNERFDLLAFEPEPE